MTTEFDRIIRELAEGELRCYRCAGMGTIPCECVFDSIPHSFDKCLGCRGFTRIVPFASLRNRCLGVLRADEVVQGNGMCFVDIPELAAHLELKVSDCECRGRGWVPEPDVEKALRRISLVLADDVRDESEAQHLVDNMEDDSLLLLAKAWLNEKMKEPKP